MLKVNLTQVGDDKLEKELQTRFNTVEDALLIVRSHVRDMFGDHNFSFAEITRYVFMIMRDGANAGLIIITDEG